MKYLVMVSDLVARQVYVDADSQEKKLLRMQTMALGDYPKMWHMKRLWIVRP
jgi:hypothetical protein